MGFAQFIASDPDTGIEVQLDFAAASPFHLEERDLAAEGIRSTVLTRDDGVLVSLT